MSTIHECVTTHLSRSSDSNRMSHIPQLQNKNDPNLAMCPSDHPFISLQALEAEGLKLLEGIITMLYTNT